MPFPAVVLALVVPAFAAPTCLGPTAYVKKADSPFDLSGVGVNFLFDDFEGDTRIAGVTASAGSRIGPQQSGIVDSVDEDDGVLDGSGLQGHSWFSGSGSGGIRFTFDAQVFGGLPTAAGIVWTDGAGTVSFEAMAADGTTVICPIGPVSDPGFPDGSSNGGTAEDRFFGVFESTGISSIRLSNSGGGIELDHIQFGQVGLATATTTSTVTTGTSTSTTTPAGGCIRAATFDSILCLLDQLIADTGSASDLGRFETGQVNRATRARKQAGQARDARKAKVARSQVKKAAKTLQAFERTLRSNNGKRVIPAATRERLGLASSGIRQLLTAVRATL